MNELTTIANSAEEGRLFTVIKIESLDDEESINLGDMNPDDNKVCKICYEAMI